LKKLLITGGCGFIGSNFVRHTLENYPDYKIVNLDKLTYAGNPGNLTDIEKNPRYRFVKGDIVDAALVQRIFAEEQIDTVVHFAAESHVDRSITGPAEFVQTNIMGTFNLLEAAREAWLANGKTGMSKDACRFLHVSTDEVYGSLGETGAFQETTPYDPRSPYSASKASSDHLVSAYFHTYGLPTLITNCSNNYGPYQFPENSSRSSSTTPFRERRCPFTATAKTSATGFMLSITAKPSSPFCRRAGSAKPTTSVATAKSKTLKSSTPSVIYSMKKSACLRTERIDEPSSPTSKTAPATIAAMPSTPRKSALNWAGRPK